jgi:hypothetical protein
VVGGGGPEGEGTRTVNKQRKKKKRIKKRNKEKRRILRMFQPFLSTMKSGLAKRFFTKTA